MGTMIINGQFLVNTERNEINEKKVEPRLMKLLSLLVENKGKVVCRSTITELLWDGYGGADEGLTQSISFLRKVFRDKDRKIIETIPKNGYVFNGTIEKKMTESPLPKIPAGKKRIKSKFTMAAAACISLTILFGYISTKSKDAGPEAVKNSNRNFSGRHDSLHHLKHAAWINKKNNR